MNLAPSTEKRRFRKWWLLLPVAAIALLITLLNFGEAPQLNADKFSEDFIKAAPGMNLRVVYEIGGAFDAWELPQMTQLRVSRLTHRGPVIEMINGLDGTTTFGVEDDLTKTNFEIRQFFKNQNVIAIAVLYPQSQESRANQIRDELRTRANGVRLFTRKGLMFSPGMASVPSTNLASGKP